MARSRQPQFALLLALVTLGTPVLTSCGDDDNCTSNCAAQTSTSGSSSSGSGEGGAGGAAGAGAMGGAGGAGGGGGAGGLGGAGGAGGSGAGSPMESYIPIDPTFNGGLLTTTPMRNGDDSGTHVLRRSDGKIVVIGFNQSNRSILVERFSASGTIDTTFGIQGAVLVEIPYNAIPGGGALSPDGKILVGGNRNRFGGSITRLHPDGALDETFAPNGRIVMPDMFPNAIRVQADGKVVIVGGKADPTGQSPFRMRRFLSTGAVDSSFGVAGTVAIDNGSAAETGQAIVFDSKLRLITVGGPFNELIVNRFNPNGALDTTFNGTGTASSTLANPAGLYGTNALATQADDKIVVGGRKNGGSVGAVLRFGVSGALDTSFDGDGIADVGTTSINSLAVAPSGAVYATASQTVFRLTSAGTPDAAFAATGSLGLPFRAYGSQVAMDGSVYVVGEDSNYNVGLSHVKVDGTLEAAFGNAGAVIHNIGASNDSIISLGLQPDGKIVAAGVAVGHVAWMDGWVAARYTPDGVLDTSFATGGRLFSPLPKQLVTTSVAVDAIGRIALTGLFLNCLAAKFTPNGAVDPTFGNAGEVEVQFVPGKAAGCLTSAFDNAGRLLVVGSTSTTASSFGLARLQLTGAYDPAFAGTGATTTAVGDVNGSSAALAVTLQNDGKIVAAGYGPLSANASGFGVARYLENGTLDTSFDGDGERTFDAETNPQTITEGARAVIQAPDGKLLLTGYSGKPISAGGAASLGSFIGDDGEYSKLIVVRLLADGSSDTSFGFNGVVALDFGYQALIGRAIQRDDNGNIYVAGELFDGVTARGFMVRLFDDGTPDPAFGTVGLALLPATRAGGLGALLKQPDGKVVAGGGAFVNPTGLDFALLRLP